VRFCDLTTVQNVARRYEGTIGAHAGTSIERTQRCIGWRNGSGANEQKGRAPEPAEAKQDNRKTAEENKRQQGEIIATAADLLWIGRSGVLLF